MAWHVPAAVTSKGRVRLIRESGDRSFVEESQLALSSTVDWLVASEAIWFGSGEVFQDGV